MRLFDRVVVYSEIDIELPALAEEAHAGSATDLDVLARHSFGGEVVKGLLLHLLEGGVDHRP